MYKRQGVTLFLSIAGDRLFAICRLGAVDNCLIAISVEDDAEDTDNGGGFCVVAHAANSEVPKTAPSIR